MIEQEQIDQWSKLYGRQIKEKECKMGFEMPHGEMLLCP